MNLDFLMLVGFVGIAALLGAAIWFAFDLFEAIIGNYD